MRRYYLKRPIGVIDSGVGGLTVAKEIMRQLPNEQILYMGDTARCPYGPRSAEEVRTFTWQMTDFLLEKEIKMLVIACNTATAVVLDEIGRNFPYLFLESFTQVRVLLLKQRRIIELVLLEQLERLKVLHMKKH